VRRRRKPEKNWLNLAICTTITVFVWIGFDVYRVLHRSSIPPVLQSQLRPLNPDFDKETLKSLEKRKTISQRELDSTPELNQLKLKEETEEEVAGGETQEASPAGEISRVE
jgi:hypothetical protein